MIEERFQKSRGTIETMSVSGWRHQHETIA